jgi:hypothetical protein
MPRAVGLDRAYREAIDQRRPWTPALLRPALWLDAADLSTISTATGVSQLRDKGPNARNFTQGTGGTQPTLTPNGLNGRNVLSFNGSQWLTSVDTAATWNFLHNTNGSSVFAVWKAGNISDPNAPYGLMGNSAIATANTGYALFFDDRAASSRNEKIITQIVQGVGGVPVVQSVSADQAHPPNVPTILSHIADPNNGAAANRSLIRVNRGAVIQNNVETAAPSASNASFAVQIGAAGNNSSPLVGYIAEIVVLASVASTAVRQQIEGHLAWKWGLRNALTAGHPFANRPPLIGG